MRFFTLSPRRAQSLRRIRRRAWTLIAISLLWQAGTAAFFSSPIGADPALAQPSPQEKLP